MTDMPNNKEGPQAREPSKCLNGQSYRERLAKEAFRLPATRGSKKDSDGAITPAMEAAYVPPHFVLPGSLQAKKLQPLHAQLSLGQSCHRRKRNSCVYTHRSLRSCPTRSNPVDCGLLGFSVRGVLQARILGRTGQYWLPYPSRTLLFSAAVAANTPEYLVWPEPLQPKQLHHLHTWPSQGQTQALQGSLRSNPQWTTHMQRWK